MLATTFAIASPRSQAKHPDAPVPQTDLERSAYGSHYGSGKLFRFLDKHIVNDHIHLHVKIHAERRS